MLPYAILVSGILNYLAQASEYATSLAGRRFGLAGVKTE